MTFEGQEKPGQHAKQRRKVKTGKDRAKEGWAKLRGGGGVYPTLKGGTSPWPRAGPGPHPRRLLGRFVGHLGAFLFSIVFSMPFLIDFWSIFHPNLAPKIDQNRSKIDAKMHSILDYMFESFFFHPAGLHEV